MNYTPPAGNNADFELKSYTPPSGDNADFDLSQSTQKTILGKVRIYLKTVKTILGKIRISVNTSKTILGKVFIILPATKKTIKGIVDIFKSTSKNISGKVSILFQTQKTITGKIRIRKLEGGIKYRILVKDGYGNLIGEFEKFRALKFGKRLNNYGTASFEIPMNDPKVSDLILLRVYTVEIYEYRNETNVLVWAGEQAVREGNLNKDKNNWCTIYCYTWLEQLKDRYTDAVRTFEATDQGLIAWTLIDETQSDGYYGDFGIRLGTIEATVDRDREYFNQNIMEALINLSNVISGFDFEITDAKIFNAKSVIGTDKSDDIIFEYGVNISSMKIVEDFVNPVNRAIVLGQSTDDLNNLVRIQRDNDSSQALYKLREITESAMTVTETQTMEDIGDSYLRKYAQALFKIDMELVMSTKFTMVNFGLGDVIRLIVKDGIYDINEQYRVFEWSAECGTGNTVKLSLVLGNFTL